VLTCHFTLHGLAHEAGEEGSTAEGNFPGGGLSNEQFEVVWRPQQVELRRTL
jgi:hypothetical protein